MKVRLKAMDERECYARCYGGGDPNVRVVKREPRRPRNHATISGEDLRRRFETRLDGRERERT